MNTEQKIQLIKKNTEEVLTEDELRQLLDSGIPLNHYIGFEISGLVHLGTGLVCMQKVKDLQDAGVHCSIFLADWHSWMNDKLGGNKEAIRNIGIPYFIEGLKAGFRCVGGDPDTLTFVLGSDLYHHNDDFLATIIEVSKHTTLSRVKRSSDIMGRVLDEKADFAKFVYPPMSVADLFVQGVNIAHGGMDQRKTHVIARAVAFDLETKPLIGKDGEKIKPIAVHHPLLLGLQKPAVWPIPPGGVREARVSAKMSKSKVGSAVFIHDAPDVIREKIKSAFCPPGEIAFNPIIDWASALIFSQKGKVLHVTRKERFGGDVTFTNFDELRSAFSDGSLHPEDLKSAVAERVIEILTPAREHFEVPENREKVNKMEKLLAPKEKVSE